MYQIIHYSIICNCKKIRNHLNGKLQIDWTDYDMYTYKRILGSYKK